MRRTLSAAAVLIAVLTTAAPAAAGPVADSDAEYSALGRVFPHPLANCQRANPQPPACSPNAQGNTPATSHIGYEEFVGAMRYMNQKPEWQRFMEVLPLDGKLGDGAGNAAAPDVPGNNLGRLEFDPRAEYVSAGLPTTTIDRRKSDLIVVRVTDESVPDEGKKRYALSLSIHGIERAGAEGGIRAIEDLVTAATTGRSDLPIVPKPVKDGAPSRAEVLRRTIIYFTFPNPDGWRRGSISEGGVFFQRYNGNGIDPNRDWPDIGFSFRPYSTGSEPETRAFMAFYREVKEKTGSTFAAGDDLHGQPDADALSYTLLPHGRHDYGKDFRLREASIRINRAQYEAVKWNPRIQENDQPVCGTGSENDVTIADDCPRIYAQTWGSVYDTINYTTTGTLGDWFDSVVGLAADGIDNEMSFSHLDRNIVFDPEGEQMHVDGNQGLIYSHVVEILDPPSRRFNAPGRKAFVPNKRLTRAERTVQGGPPPGTVAQETIDQQGLPGQTTFPFTVKGGPQADGKNIYNGGMRVEITTANFQGIATGTVSLDVQCRFCDDHPGVPVDDRDGNPENDWITVAEDFNQSPIYAQAGVVATVNRPQVTSRTGKKVEWRAVVSRQAGAPRMRVFFTQDPITDAGNTGGGDPPVLRGYDVANTDLFRDLNRFIDDPGERFDEIDPRRVISGEQSLEGVRSLVLADNALPGYTGPYRGAPLPTGPPTPNFDFASTKPTQPGFYQPSVHGRNRVPNSFETKDFKIARGEGNADATIRIEWELEDNDFDMYVYRKVSGGGLTLVGSSAEGGTKFEEVKLQRPPAGDYVIYVDNWASADPRWKGTVRFSPLPPEERNRGTGDFTEQEKDVWFAKLRAFVEGGGNLVLTDAALRGLSEITNIPGEAVEQATVYVGQVSFGKSSSEPTVEDPLATTPETIRQPAARFNDGMRRQTYESTPLGFAIQNQAGSDASFAPQFDIDRKAFEQAGGRVAGTSADAAPRTARPVYDRVALGEIKVGKGQIRVAGGLLPQPSQAFDHQLGIEPYALTYTGYILVRNLLSIPGIDAPPVSPPGPIVDRVAPQVRISSPTYSTERGRRGEFRVRWRGTDAGTGVFSYLLQVRELGPRGRARTRRTRVPAATPWRTLAAATRATSRVIRGRRGRTYQFRLRAVDGAGNISPFRAATTVVPLDDRDRGIRFRGRGWRTFLSRIAYMGRFRSSVRRGDTYRLVYRGESIALIGRRGPRGGKALVRFDRRRPRVIDFYAPNYLRRRVLIRFGAGPGRHVITVRVLGRKQRASRWTEVNLDGFGVARRG